MRGLIRLWRWIRDVVCRREFERELDAELRTFLSMSAQAELSRGAGGEATGRRARIEMGGIEQVKERVRDVRGGARIETFWRDVRHAARLMRRQPGFSAVVILTLALGIGANTAIFSVVKAVLLAPLPFEDSGRLVRLLVTRSRAGGNGVATSVNPLYFQAIRDRASLLESVAAQRYQNLTMSGDGEPERVVGIGVSDGWIETLGVQPMLGRAFSEAEEEAGSGSDVALLSHAFWRRRFGGDAAILGRVIRLNGRVFTVIGVMPPSFRYPYNTDLWLPMTVSRTATSPGDLNVPARFREGATFEQVRTELEAIGDRLARELVGFDDVGIVVRPFSDEFRRDPDRSIAALLAAVGFVLLIACANVANLMLARSGSRAMEIAVRSALGAGRGRQLRQLLTESLLLAAFGGLVGVLLAGTASRWLAVLIPSRLGEVVGDVQVDGTVLIASIVLCLLTGLLFGLPPAFRLTRSGVMAGLREKGPVHRRSGNLLDALVVTEVAVATLLLAVAGLMARNFAVIVEADPGYDAARLLHVNIGLPEPTYDDPERRVIAVTRIVERVEAVPGVMAAGITTLQPVPRTTANTGTALRTAASTAIGDAPPIVNERFITPGYFRAMGMRVIAGREFSEGDASASSPVSVISETAARRFWPGSSALGASLRHGPVGDPDSVSHEVIGVVSDIAEPYAEMDATVYRAYAQGTGTQPAGMWTTTRVTLIVRTAGAPAMSIDAVRAAIHEVDPALPLFDIAPLESVLADPLAATRLGAFALAGFGGFGLLMAVLGTYAVLAFSVARRIPEFGLRMALGARPGQLQRMVIGRGLGLIAAGLAIGIALTLLLAEPLRVVMTEVDPRDPIVLGAAVAALLFAGALACWVPARRATRVDPVCALRAEN